MTATLVSLTLFASSAHSAPKTILVLGDSLSAEYGLARGAGWVSLLESRLSTESIDAIVINASISGETTSGGKSRFANLLEKNHPAVVVIELGGNDGLRGLPIKASEDNLRSIINAAKKAQAKVLLVGMQIPPNYGRNYTDQFSALYPKLAKETSSALVPFLLTGVADRPELFQSDRIHLKAQAHPIMLNNVWAHLKPLLIK
ncbi:MAG: arylesterase [Glaciimonas sp.]|nr:arylesterase [Glaciimonas sp.]